MDRFEEMQTFLRVVDEGSLSAAASSLEVAKSAISRRLNDLEARLGVQLITRTTRRLNLTDTGRQYYQRCQQILADVEETEQEVSSDSQALRGTIRIATPLSFGIKYLSPVLDGFLKLYPDINLDVDLNDRTVNIMEEDVNLAIRIGRLSDSSLIARYLAPSKLVICASPAYLEKHGEPEHPQDLLNHASLVYSHIPESLQWQFLQPDKSGMSVQMSCRLKANNGDVLLNAAIEGLGILSIPSFISSVAIEQGLLKPILVDYPLQENNIYAVYPRQRYLAKQVRVLIDYLVEEFSQIKSL